MTQVYSIYCEKDTEQSEKRCRAIVRLLGIFGATIRNALFQFLPRGRVKGCKSHFVVVLLALLLLSDAKSKQALPLFL